MSGLKSAGTGVTLSLTLSRPEVVAPLTDHLLRAGPRAGPACGFSGQGGLSLIYRLTPGMGGGGRRPPGIGTWMAGSGPSLKPAVSSPAHVCVLPAPPRLSAWGLGPRGACDLYPQQTVPSRARL